ncbi:MAG: tRNA pseudouridine(38-40) synthase TruA [Rhizobiales bacterium]|nr:tRNA pseudouridine(38-40) synthase TruA [Hyphomicrobiales bacterium]
MPRYKLTIEYDGGPYVGWQKQNNGASVQQHLAEAASAFSGEDVTVYGAGRTDAGVHARGQVAHVDFASAREPETIRDAINFYLKPEPIAVLHVEAVADEFEARFGAIRRRYLYRIINRRSPLALEAGLAWRVPVPLDVVAMAAGAKHLLGKHDFTTFRSVVCQAKSPVKNLDRLDVERHGNEILIHAEARSFMHHQVRSIVGSLKCVGAGKWQPDDMRKALEACDRAACGPVAPADGLYFAGVDYQ